MPDWLSAPPAAGTSVRTRGITERAGKNNAKEYFYENEENGSGFYGGTEPYGGLRCLPGAGGRQTAVFWE